MLQEPKARRAGWLIGITVLFSVIAWLTFQVGIYKGEVKTANTIQSYTEAQNADLQENLKQYGQAVNYYQRLLSRALIIQEDTMIPVKKGTMLIPPQQEPREEEEQ